MLWIVFLLRFRCIFTFWTSSSKSTSILSLVYSISFITYFYNLLFSSLVWHPRSRHWEQLSYGKLDYRLCSSDKPWTRCVVAHWSSQLRAWSWTNPRLWLWPLPLLDVGFDWLWTGVGLHQRTRSHLPQWAYQVPSRSTGEDRERNCRPKVSEINSILCDSNLQRKCSFFLSCQEYMSAVSL